MPLTSDVGAQQMQIDKFFMVLTLIGLHPDLKTVRDQILGRPSIPSLDDVVARLLHISSTQTLPYDSTLDSSVLVSHCTYCNKFGHNCDRCYQLHGRPPCIAHVASHLILILSRPKLRAPPHLRVIFPPLTMSMMTIFAIRQPSQFLLLLLVRPVMLLPALLIHLLFDHGF